jgi:NAD(P)H-nitrite reductase large subunit
VVIAQVDADLNPIESTYRTITCDTLLTSVGLIPENELARLAQIDISPVTSGAVVDDNFMTSDEGIFECGNVLHVHDLVDYVSMESQKAGEAAANYIKNGKPQSRTIEVTAVDGIRYTVPQKINTEGDEPLTLRMRVGNVYKKVKIVIKKDGEVIFGKMRPIVTPGEMETLTLPSDISRIIRSSNGISVGLEAI